MMMLQIVQKLAASMDLFPPVMAPSVLLRTHELTIRATRQHTNFQMKFSLLCLHFPEDYTRIMKIRLLFQFVQCLCSICTNVFFVRCIIPLFHPPIGMYTRYFLTLGAIMDFSRVQREKSIIARLEI